MPANDKNGKQLMDVAKPGKTPASASSRPIIVGHKPIIHDPMVSSSTPGAGKPEARDEEAKPIAPSESKRVIAPLAENKEIASAEGTSASEKSNDNDASDAAIVDAVIDQVASKKQEDKQSEETQKKKEELGKLIAEKKYFVPISKTPRKRKSRLLLGVLAFVIVIGLSFAVVADAGLINGVSVPFNLIDDAEQEVTNEATAAVDTTESATAKTDIPAPAATVPTDPDGERKTDINTLHTRLEAYYAQHGKYPTLDNLNDEAFRMTNMQGLDEDVLKDPNGSAAVLAAVARDGTYSYAATADGGGACDNETVGNCSEYILTATLSTGAYTKSSLN